MSYLNPPHFHFTGRFQADPPTINNNDSNFDPTAKLDQTATAGGSISNTSVYWNKDGTHNWLLDQCTVRGAANANGPFSDSGTDPIIGASVIANGPYTAKIVDLDPDNQAVSQIFGLQIQVTLRDPADASKVLASLTASMPPTAFGDLWVRAANPSLNGMPAMSAVFQAVLEEVVWENPGASPLLSELHKESADALSLRFIVDSYQSDSNQDNFRYGRIVGTIGPVRPGEAPRSTPRRLAPFAFKGKDPSKLSASSPHGPCGAVFDAQRGVLILDLGNSVPTNGAKPSSDPTVPLDGWPIDDKNFELTLSNPREHVTEVMELKSGAQVPAETSTPTSLGKIQFSLDSYTTYAGIIELPVSATNVEAVQKQPLLLTDVTDPANPMLVVAEDEEGRYVDVDKQFFRLNPGDVDTVTLWATKYGAPWSEAVLAVALAPAESALNGPKAAPFLWQNGFPSSALSLSSNLLITGEDGTAKLRLRASDPGTPRTYPNGQPGPDGQLYWIKGEWSQWGKIFLYPPAPINVLVFSGRAIPTQPTWSADVGPILSNYARMYPRMKTIIDLSDYDSVVRSANAIQRVMNLPPTDPHHMPISRDLSRDKLAIINHWFSSGMPK